MDTTLLNATLQSALEVATNTSATCPSLVINLTTVFMALIGTLRDNTTRTPPVLARNDTWDFIIVGGGSAGCVLASRLSEIPDWRVLLIEAGGEEPYEADVPAFIPFFLSNTSSINWNYLSQPGQKTCGGVGCEWPRARVLGGCSVHNGMMYMRGNRKDYERWAEVGNTGWGYEDVLKYFIKSEDNRQPLLAEPKYHGTGGYIPVEQFPYQDINVKGLIHAFREMGYAERDLNGAEQEGVMRAQTTSKNGERYSSNTAFLRPIRDQRQNLTILTNARVTKILFDSNKTAIGVQYALDSNRSDVLEAYASKEVIVSGGTVNSPQLLQLSGVGPAEYLGPLNIPVIQDLSVGFNLQDHVSSSGVQFILKETDQTPLNSNRRMKDIIDYVKDSKGPLSATGVAQVTAFARSQYAKLMNHYPDIQFLFDPIYEPPNNTQEQMTTPQAPTSSTTPSTTTSSTTPDYYNCDNTIENSTMEASNVTQANTTAACAAPELIEPLSYYNRIIVRPSVLRPRSRGLLIINSTDPFAPPRIFPNYLSESPDMQILIEGLLIAARLSQTQVLPYLGFSLDVRPLPLCSSFRFGSFAYWTCVATQYTKSMNHPIGTCKMGPSFDKNAVVDPELRVYGVNNLRVIDASIMPYIVSGNTHAPTVMIAEKGSDMIKRRWLRTEEDTPGNRTTNSTLNGNFTTILNKCGKEIVVPVAYVLDQQRKNRTFSQRLVAERTTEPSEDTTTTTEDGETTTTMSNFQDMEGTTQSFQDMEGTTQSFQDTEGTTQSFQDTEGTTQSFEGIERTTRNLEDMETTTSNFQDEDFATQNFEDMDMSTQNVEDMEATMENFQDEQMTSTVSSEAQGTTTTEPPETTTMGIAQEMAMLERMAMMEELAMREEEFATEDMETTTMSFEEFMATEPVDETTEQTTTIADQETDTEEPQGNTVIEGQQQTIKNKTTKPRQKANSRFGGFRKIKENFLLNFDWLKS